MCDGWGGDRSNSVDQNSVSNFTAVLPNATLNPAVTTAAPVLSQTTKSPGSTNITTSGSCHPELHNSTEVNAFINRSTLHLNFIKRYKRITFPFKNSHVKYSVHILQ